MCQIAIIYLFNMNFLYLPDGVKAAAEIESSTPFDQRVFDVLNSKVASEPSVEDAVDLLVLKTAAVTAHRNSVK